MKAGWDVKALGDVCEIQSGAGFPKDLQGALSGDFPFFKVGDMNAEGNEQALVSANNYVSDVVRRSLGAKIISPGSVVFPKVGGAIATNKKRKILVPSCVDNNVMGLTPRTDLISPDFLSWWLEGFDIYEFSNKAALPSITKATVEAWPIPLPPLEEQQWIVAVLDEAFEGLARARAHAEANLQNARELFENYRESYLDPSRRQGWSLRKLDDLITIKHGFAFKSAFFVDQGQYAVLTPGNYHETGGFRDRGGKQRYYSGEFPPEFLLRKDDLLMAMTEQAPGLLGSCIIVPEDEAYLHNQRLGLISPKDGVAWSPEYFSQAFNLKAFRKGLSDTCSGATVRHTSPGRILAEAIPYSDDVAELEAAALDLAERENDCRDLEAAYREKIRDLDDLRQSLLQKAFAGELT